jgi:hypothetical protein
MKTRTVSAMTPARGKREAFFQQLKHLFRLAGLVALVVGPQDLVRSRIDHHNL